jgi:two-component system chemotaxis response regulator CheY
MLIALIHEQAETQFLAMLQMPHSKIAGRSAMLCSFSQTPLKVEVDSAVLILKDILHDQEGEIYFCADGDVAICWRGRVKETRQMLIKAFLTNYGTKLESYNPEKLYHLFDIEAHGEELRILFRNKLHNQHEQEKKMILSSLHDKAIEFSGQVQLEFSDKQYMNLQRIITTRASRRLPEILVVEDQDFSRRLLQGLIEKEYVCYGAENAKVAMALYAERAPDITFLDIELPDIDGHTLATLFKRDDPKSCIVMVTGNNYAKDVEAAKANKVQGFIVKPYTRQKIMSAIDTFIARKKG